MRNKFKPGNTAQANRTLHGPQRADGIKAQRVRLSAEVIALVLEVLGPGASPAEVAEFIRAAVAEKIVSVKAVRV